MKQEAPTSISRSSSIRSDQIRTIDDDKESRDRVERMKHNMEEWERKHP